MEVYFHGEGSTYNATYFDELTACMNKFDDDLLFNSQNDAWAGMISYY